MRARLRAHAPACVVTVAAALALVACTTPSISPASSGLPQAEVDPQAERVKQDLADEFEMSFEPAGPHHELGTAPDGVELDLVGVPVEEVILSLPVRDRAAGIEAGLAYLPHLRGLLHGPGPVWNWVADALACRADAGASCNASTSQGSLSAHLTDDSGFVVLVIARE